MTSDLRPLSALVAAPAALRLCVLALKAVARPGPGNLGRPQANTFKLPSLATLELAVESLVLPVEEVSVDVVVAAAAVESVALELR